MSRSGSHASRPRSFPASRRYIVPPPPGTFNLTLNKVADPKDCIPDGVAGGVHYVCRFRIFVTNTGTTVYSGPIIVDDLILNYPAGSIVTFSPQPPWMCAELAPGAHQCVLPGVTLFPGQHVELDVEVATPRNYDQCELTNAAELEWPQGWQDGNPDDDFSIATARIPNPACKPQGSKTNLKIYKLAKKQCRRQQSGDYVCRYQVAVQNMGPGVYNGPLQFTDTVPAGSTATFSGPHPWACAGGPPTYTCNHPAVTLNPGEWRGVRVDVTVPAGAVEQGQCKLPNKVHITQAPGGSDLNTNPADDDAQAVATIASERCLEKKSNLKIEKVPYGQCERTTIGGAPGMGCGFWIVIRNTGPGVYNGNIAVDDTFAGARGLDECGRRRAMVVRGRRTELDVHVS